MHRLFIILLYCAITPTMAQIPSVSLGGGAATSNGATVPSATFQLLYDVATDPHNDHLNDHHNDPHKVLLGINARQLYGVPTQIEAFTASSSSIIGTNGSSTITTLMATAGYRFHIPSTALHIGVLGSIGGASAAHRRLEEIGGYYNISPDEQQPYMATTYFASSFAYAVSATVDLDLSASFALSLDLGYHWLSPSLITIDNQRYNATSYRAIFASPGTSASLALRYTLPNSLPNGLRDTLPEGLLEDPHEDHLQLLAIVASTHPFTTTPYNEFNPGLALHWRPRSSGVTPFAEGGAYQYSVGDRAMYLGGGVLFPLGTEWVKGGIFGGLLTTFDAQSAYFYPALSPRITIDTPWASATALLIPAGDATAIGFVVGFPLF